jgi:hypothetical protein
MDKIQQLAKLRKEYQGAYDARKERKETLLDDEEYKSLTETKERLANELSSLISEIKTEAVQVYNETQNKNPFDHVVIKLHRVLSYDKMLAIKYCLQYMPSLVQINETKFNQAVRDSNLNFVTLTLVPVAYISEHIEVKE